MLRNVEIVALCHASISRRSVIFDLDTDVFAPTDPTDLPLATWPSATPLLLLLLVLLLLAPPLLLLQTGAAAVV